MNEKICTQSTLSINGDCEEASIAYYYWCVEMCSSITAAYLDSLHAVKLLVEQTKHIF